MDLNPYVQGAITAVVYLATNYFMPKKIQGIKRVVVVIVVAVAVSLFVHFIIDRIAVVFGLNF